MTKPPTPKADQLRKLREDMASAYPKVKAPKTKKRPTQAAKAAKFRSGRGR